VENSVKPVLIFGAGQVAQVFNGYLSRNHLRPDAHVVDASHWQPNTWIGETPVCAFEQVGRVTFTPPENSLFVVGMSYKGLNRPRAEKYQAMLGRGFRPLTFVHPMCAKNYKSIGHGSFVMDLNVMQDGVEIGENCILWSGNHVGHHTKIGNHVFIASHAVISGDCEIGDRCFIGVNATIADGVKVGADCFIGPNALITQDCEPEGVYVAERTPRNKVPSWRMRW
jgi:sugar O-acyltransferase (sialic acid O-acetyltransferase NeuD family)